MKNNKNKNIFNFEWHILVIDIFICQSYISKENTAGTTRGTVQVSIKTPDTKPKHLLDHKYYVFFLFPFLWTCLISHLELIFEVNYNLRVTHSLCVPYYKWPERKWYNTPYPFHCVNPYVRDSPAPRQRQLQLSIVYVVYSKVYSEPFIKASHHALVKTVTMHERNRNSLLTLKRFWAAVYKSLRIWFLDK